MAEDETGKQEKTVTQADAKETKSPPKLKSAKKATAKKATAKKKAAKKKVVKKTVVKKRNPAKKRVAVGTSKKAPEPTATTGATASQTGEQTAATAPTQAAAVPAGAMDRPGSDSAQRSATTGSDSEESRTMTTKTSQSGSKSTVGFWPIVLIWVVIILAGFMYIRSLAHKEAVQSQPGQTAEAQVSADTADAMTVVTDASPSDTQIGPAEAEAILSDPPADLSTEMTVDQPPVQTTESTEPAEAVNLAPGSLQAGLSEEVKVDKPEPALKTTDTDQEKPEHSTVSTPSMAPVETAVAPMAASSTISVEGEAAAPAPATAAKPVEADTPVSAAAVKAPQPPQSSSTVVENTTSAEALPRVKEPATGTVAVDQPSSTPAAPAGTVGQRRQSLRERFGYTRPMPRSRYPRQRAYQPPVAAAEDATQPEEGRSVPQQALRYRPRYQPGYGYGYGYGYPYPRPGYGYPGYGGYYPGMTAPQAPSAASER